MRECEALTLTEKRNGFCLSDGIDVDPWRWRRMEFVLICKSLKLIVFL